MPHTYIRVPADFEYPIFLAPGRVYKVNPLIYPPRYRSVLLDNGSYYAILRPDWDISEKEVRGMRFFRASKTVRPGSSVIPNAIYEVDEYTPHSTTPSFYIRGNLFCLERGCAHLSSQDWTPIDPVDAIREGYVPYIRHVPAPTNRREVGMLSTDCMEE